MSEGRVYFHATFLDCANNGYRGTQLFRYFQANGYGEAARPEDADVIVINTCAFDQRRENDAFAVVRDYARRYGTDKKVIVAGCLAGINKAVRDVPGVIAVGPRELGRLDELFAARVPVAQVRADLIRPDLYAGADAPDYHIQICQGCASRCTYCAIRNAKGAVTSQAPEAVGSEVDEALRRGFRRIVLLADDCGSYGLDRGTDFAALLNGLCRTRSGDYAFNIHYFEPGRLLDQFPRIDAEVWERRVESVCIPMQSLSPAVLRRMNRDYDPEAVLDVTRRIRALNPRLRLDTHLLYGFPGQTRAELEGDLRLASYFDTVVCFFYTDRPGIPSRRLDGKLTQSELLYRTWRLCRASRRAPGLQLEYEGGVPRHGRRFGEVFRFVRADVPEDRVDVLLIQTGRPEPSPDAPASLLAAAATLVERGLGVRLLDARLEPDPAGEAERVLRGSPVAWVGLAGADPALGARLRAVSPAPVLEGLAAVRAQAGPPSATESALPYYLLAGYEGRYGADVLALSEGGRRLTVPELLSRLSDCREHLHVGGDLVVLEEEDFFSDPARLEDFARAVDDARARHELPPFTWSARAAARSLLRSGAPLLRRLSTLGLRTLTVSGAGPARPRLEELLARLGVKTVFE